MKRLSWFDLQWILFFLVQDEVMSPKSFVGFWISKMTRTITLEMLESLKILYCEDKKGYLSGTHKHTGSLCLTFHFDIISSFYAFQTFFAFPNTGIKYRMDRVTIPDLRSPIWRPFHVLSRIIRVRRLTLPTFDSRSSWFLELLHRILESTGYSIEQIDNVPISHVDWFPRSLTNRILNCTDSDGTIHNFRTLWFRVPPMSFQEPQIVTLFAERPISPVPKMVQEVGSGEWIPNPEYAERAKKRAHQLAGW